MPDIPVPAIYFHPDQVEGQGRDLVGRRSAGESFLKGFLRHAGGDTVRAVVESATAATEFEAKVRALGDTRPVSVTELRGNSDFTAAGTVFFPAPGYQSAAWRRLRFGPGRCSLVGVTHTVSTKRIVENLHGLMSQPVEPWDAIICTSRAVQSVVKRQFDLETEYFRHRFGATRMPLPQLPVIPLGIETADFAPLPGARDRLRAARGVPKDAVVVLTMGRLSVVEKANPVPMMLALEQAAEQTGREVHLWMTGWASRAEEEALHREAGAALCRRVKFTLLDGRDADIRRNIWAAADIFTLPADSIQETFGLVPVEAMAAGLPVVMPDWDGFRDTVPHGEAGIRVATRMAPPGTGAALARRFADDTDSYLQYLTLVQSQIQIDVPAYAAAFAALIGNDELRRRMGANALAHARRAYDWAAVIPHYLALAQELAAIRARGTVSTPPLAPGAISPLEVDPFDLYRDYPTRLVGADTILHPGVPVDAERLALLGRLSGQVFYRRQQATPELLLRVAAVVQAKGAISARDLAAAGGASVETVMAAALQLAKFDILRLAPEPPRP